MEPIDFQEKLWKQQQQLQVAMQDPVGRIASLEQAMIDEETNFDSNLPPPATTESVPLQFFYTKIVRNSNKNNNQTWHNKQIEKVKGNDQKLNLQLLEHLKAKQAETLKEWLKLQEKHNKQEQIMKDLKDKIEKQIDIESEFKIDDLLSIDSIIAITKSTPDSTTTSTNRFRTISKSLWKPKPILNSKSFISIPRLHDDNQNKCANKKFGIHRDEMNCSTFYICEKLSTGTELMHKFTCPFGFEFDVLTCICDIPKSDSSCLAPLHDTSCKDVDLKKIIATTERPILTTSIPIATTTTPSVLVQEQNSNIEELNCENKNQGSLQ